MEFLRNRLEKQQYEMMVRNIKPRNNTISLFSAEEGESVNEVKVIKIHTYANVKVIISILSQYTNPKKTKNQISAILNIMLSMISVFLAIFIWMKNEKDYLVCLIPHPLRPPFPVPLVLSRGSLLLDLSPLASMLIPARSMESFFRGCGWGE